MRIFEIIDAKIKDPTLSPETREKARALGEQLLRVWEKREAMQGCPALCLMEIRRLSAINSDHTFQYIPRAFWKNEAFCREAVSITAEALEWIHETYLTGELCLEAVRRDGSALQFVVRQLLTPGLCLEAVKQRPAAIRHVPSRLLTREIVQEAVQRDPATLALIPAEWKPEAKTALSNSR